MNIIYFRFYDKFSFRIDMKRNDAWQIYQGTAEAHMLAAVYRVKGLFHEGLK